MSLFITDTYNHNNHKVIISGPTGTVSGFLTSGLSLGANASYGTVMEKSQFQEKVKKLIHNIMPNSQKSIGVEFPVQQRKSWSESDLGDISISMKVVSLNGEDIKSKIKPLYGGVLPQLASNNAFSAPGGYSPNIGGRPTGTWALTVPGVITLTELVMTSVSTEFSKQLTKNGTPLYANVSVSFQLAEPISYDQFPL